MVTQSQPKTSYFKKYYVRKRTLIKTSPHIHTKINAMEKNNAGERHP